MSNIAQDIAALKNRQIILVSSGAIAIGKRLLNIKNVELIEESQALAAVGQLELIKAWKAAFSAHSIDVGQVLLTPKEIQTSKDARNALKTINQLHRFRVLPIVNENDTTATDEIQFGDNDLLAAKLAKIFKADLLIMLSSVEGLYESFNGQTNQSTLIRQVSKVTKDIHAMAGKASKSGKGGMTSKIEAAKICQLAGSSMVIANGLHNNPITKIIEQNECTWFSPKVSKLDARKKWIISSIAPKGEIIIDAVKGEINVTLSVDEIENRKKDWKPRKTNHNSGSIWKYSQTVGPAYEGAVTQPGAKDETHTYACLLYTSPSPRDKRQSRMPSSA